MMEHEKVTGREFDVVVRLRPDMCLGEDPPFLRGTSLSKIHNRAVGYRTSPLMTQTIVINNSSSLFKHHTVTLGVANTIDIRCLC